MQDAGIMEIVMNPEAYARYLELQGDNPAYSPGNIALAMAQNPEITQFGTREKWKTLGRSVSDAEAQKGVKIFSRGSFGKGYVLADAYDVTQTYGREVKQVKLEKDTPEMETALTTLLNYAVVPVTVDDSLNTPALYDERAMELYVNPNYPDNEAFPAIAGEIAHSRFHAKGANTAYDRMESELDAQSVSYILCRRFGVERELPDLSGLDAAYNGWTPQEVRRALDCVQDMSKRIGGSIERDITPQQHTRGHVKHPAR